MDIYIVQQGDTLNSISDKYGITVEKLIQDNGLIFPYNLVTGQAIVIAVPKQVYTVKEGDTLQNIVDTYNVSLMQILRNNPFLSDREYINPGETIVISYNTNGSVTTNGFAYPFIEQKTLLKTLPNLTYISILNYQVTEEDGQVSFQDDSEILMKSKEYGVLPLLVLTTLTPKGVPTYEASMRTLLDKEFQDILINQYVEKAYSRGYYGVNVIFSFLNEVTQSLYLDFVKNISYRAKQKKLLLFISVNYQIAENNNNTVFEKVNYTEFSKYIDDFIFLSFVWGTNNNPPAPVCNIYYIGILVDYLISIDVPKSKINIGKPVIGYDWKLPYINNVTSANSLNLFSVLNVAYENSSIIEFNEVSQTPYFYYYRNLGDVHIVWFLDSRSFNAIDKLIIDKSLNGSVIWNTMIYYPQLWIVIYSQYDIIKLI
ncbi:LysM peptidoglycan-binding domain-containing protein [Anaerosacchariphilus polymeriproducens]|uniref:LysM peptidoglycan-binding domain-containing protein n=1 Tax=Anaerosacchariphilus polymeriproducens TaxID=1812858 RepID=A0A371AVV4_9FIRM|nr:LysM peptidoglycan-binding domain-containing protein [Anaerosacchariphilus polymeriproducens]RDU23703.1 LysM peptidoglycan-binding domain-containing protein [Anaerosacchariphilus polymeriproducens]